MKSRRKKKNLDRGMAGSLSMEKLDRSNYAAWMYKMHQYLLGHDYWSYVNGANDATPEVTHKDLSAWEKAASKVMYHLASSVSDQLIIHIRDAKMPKESWTNLKKVFVAGTMAWKLQLM